MPETNHKITYLRKKFRLALIACDMDYAKFATHYGVTRNYISQVMAGKMSVSPRIEKAIRDFTNANMITVRNIMNEPTD
jgi:transcriptional regulator with XRE-family HTH domain